MLFNFLQEFRSYPVTKITTLSHNVKAYEISLPSPEHETVCVIYVTANLVQFNLWFILVYSIQLPWSILSDSFDVR